MRLKHKVILVTGAGRGLGSGIALGLISEGSHVIILDINAEEMSQTTEEINRTGNEVMSIVADVSNYTSMTNAINQIRVKWNRLDAVICNAATMPLIPFKNTSPEIWGSILGTNLTGVYNTIKASWQLLKQNNGGHYISIASRASLLGFEDEVAYCASKHGLEGLTKALAMEFEQHNIAINTMGPGKPIKPTSMTREQAKAIKESQKTKWINPVLLAPAFTWLLSQPPKNHTGLRFDAGPIVDTINKEGYDFVFTPEKTTLYTHDLINRIQQRHQWSIHKTDQQQPITN
ncbi:MAG: hypothetical protein CMQ51_00155 [Gammaproteobacteria bacterium]|nr:hypothetical protein [Gammaproteobacteria bacterium]